MMKESIKAYLFDFDGTLVDSMPVWRDKMFRLLHLQKITPPEGLLRQITPLGDLGTIRYYREHFALNMTDEEMFDEMDAYALPRYRDEIPAKSGVEEYLQELQRQKAGIYLLTASPRKMFLPCLERLGLLRFFTSTWSCEDFHTVKSNPEIYRMAAEKMGVSIHEIAFFDDNKVALETAKKAGTYTVGVYDETSEADESEIRRMADEYIHSFRELLPAMV